jgi:hypothetical protein
VEILVRRLKSVSEVARLVEGDTVSEVLEHG